MFNAKERAALDRFADAAMPGLLIDYPDGEDDYDLGAELLEGEWIVFANGGTVEFSIADNAGCYDGLEFIGDVGRDPISWSVND